MVALAIQDATPVLDVQKIDEKVQAAKSLLIIEHPFFGMAVSKRTIIYTDAVPTAAMSATGQMYINPAFAEPLTKRQLMWLLAHEAMHFMLSHALRRGTRLQRPWNVAADYVINDTLNYEGVGEPIEGVLDMPGARDFSTEDLYNADGDDGGGGGGGCPVGDDIGDPVDDGGQPLDDSQKHQIEALAKIETIQHAKAAKARGELPGSIERIIEEMLDVSTPWHDHLERFFQGRQRDGISWRRPNRRFLSGGVYIPGVNYVPRMGEIVIGVDTSGSIGQRELDEFNAHVNRILHTCNPEKVTVIYCDRHVNSTAEYEPDDFPVTLKLQGGGGTSFKPVFDYIDNNSMEPEVVVYLTDGEGDQSQFTSKHETVWLTTHNENFTWGTVIKFESEAT